MRRGIIYYTDNMLFEPIVSVVRQYILASGLPVVSCSLKPIDFGKNVVIDAERGYITMFKQIITALENSTAKYVFFCEHDVLYPISHFAFIPPKDDTFYYNDNVWRWWFKHSTAITYDGLCSLSSMCANRELALENYYMKMERIGTAKPELLQGREPRLGRLRGYEPGGRRWQKGTGSTNGLETWKSDQPIVDIRHKGTFSIGKVRLNQFNHPPVGWVEKDINEIPGWKLEELFSD